MTTTEKDTRTVVPDHIARQIVLPEGHRDEVALFEAYAWLRENAPLAVGEVEGYDPVYLVSKHADIMEIERQPHVFTSGGGADKGSHNPILQNQAGDAFTQSLTGGSLRILETLTYLDPPEHTAIKDIANDWFRVANLKKWEDQIRGARPRGDREVPAQRRQRDRLRAGLRTPLPAARDHDAVRGPGGGRAPHDGADPGVLRHRRPGRRARGRRAAHPRGRRAAVAAAISDFYAYFDVLVQDRRANPRDDLATIIANAKDETGAFQAKEFAYGWFIAIATAGHDTTSSTMASLIERSRSSRTSSPASRPTRR